MRGIHTTLKDDQAAKQWTANGDLLLDARQIGRYISYVPEA